MGIVTSRRAGGVGTQGGFTLIELTIVMGLLSGFILFLVQLLNTGVSLFDQGQASQELSDRSSTASLAARDAIRSMVGPRQETYSKGQPTTRLLVEWGPLELREGTGAQVQVVRTTAQIDDTLERELLARSLREQAIETADSLAPEDVAQRLSDLVAAAPRQGRAEMLLIPWPAGDADGAYLDLRRGLFLPGQRIPLSRRDQRSLMDIDDLVYGAIPNGLIEEVTEPVAVGLLHIEFSFWSQYTRSWSGDSKRGGPEWVWDSARAGLLSDSDDPRLSFSLDLGKPSLENQTDDVYPRWVKIMIVVDRPGSEARLARDLAEGEREMRLIGVDRLGDDDEIKFLKVGPEWVRASSFSGGICRGLRRGVRGTDDRHHEFGTTVRVGKTEVIYVKLPHGRDCWNG